MYPRRQVIMFCNVHVGVHACACAHYVWMSLTKEWIPLVGLAAQSKGLAYAVA